jgi:hypothetical protein
MNTGRRCSAGVPNMPRSVLVGAVAFLSALLALSGCISFSSNGPSSAEIKQNLEKSFLFRTSDVYFPNDSLGEGEPAIPPLTTAQLNGIEEDLNRLMADLVRKHEQVHGPLGEMLGVALAPVAIRRIMVLNTGQSVAQTTAVGTMQFDVKVLQAVFRSAVVTALTGGRSMMDVFAGQSVEQPKLTIAEMTTGQMSEATQLQTLRLFLDIRRRVRATPGHSHMGDFANAMHDIEHSDLGEMVELGADSQRVERDYFGALFFLLAHEQGHVALRHISDRPPRNPVERHNAELEADAYAFWLLATMIEGVVIPMFGDADLKDAMGYASFFKHAYSIAGYAGLEKTDQEGYPTRQERLALLDKLFGVYQQILAHKFDQALIDAEKNQKPRTEPIP